jgi:hypothetical protein
MDITNYRYIKYVFDKIKREHGNFAYHVMKGANMGTAYESMTEFCERIGLGEYKGEDQVIDYLRRNKHIVDYWML